MAAGYGRTMARGWATVSRVETADYSSNLYKTYNNMFGMKQPQVRKTLSTGATPSGFASFNSRESSIDDLILYLQYFNYPKDFVTLSSQIKYMKSKGYFEEGMNSYLTLAKDARDRLLSEADILTLEAKEVFTEAAETTPLELAEETPPSGALLGSDYDSPIELVRGGGIIDYPYEPLPDDYDYNQVRTPPEEEVYYPSDPISIIDDPFLQSYLTSKESALAEPEPIRVYREAEEFYREAELIEEPTMTDQEVEDLRRSLIKASYYLDQEQKLTVNDPSEFLSTNYQ